VAIGVGVHEVVAAIEDAAARGAKVINMSFSSEDEQMTTLISEAIQRHPDILFVKSAGNDGRDLATFDEKTYLPKLHLPNMVVVSAANANLTKRPQSNYGAPYSTHAALGTQIYSTVDYDDYYDWYGGTSMATPNVTNAAAKLLLLDDQLKPEQLSGILTDTTDRMENWRERTASGGIINADRAMRVAALTGLMRGGSTPEAAANQISLYGAERDELLGIADRYV
jgi:subtilisin family serine protease